MTVSIEAEGLKRRYPGSLELNVKHISCEADEVLAVLGPSGAGKSTLLRLLGLLERPDSGVIKLNGKRVSHRRLSARRRIVSALQTPMLWRGSVIENVEYGLRLRGVGRRQSRISAEEAIALVELAGGEDKKVMDLSGGEAQRVGLARAIAIQPEVLLLDEPLAHIDEPLRESLAVSMKRFIKRTGCATVWITHDRAEAMSISDTLAVIEKGKLLQRGPTMQVITKPVDEIVGRLVGTDNVIPAVVKEGSDGLLTVEASGVQIVAVGDQSQGTSVLILIRPEEVGVWIHEPVDSSPRNKYRGPLQDAVALGPVVKLYIGGPIPVVALVTRPTYEELRISVGDQLWFGFKATACHVVTRA